MAPSSVLIVGSGVFGLSTAHALAIRPSFSQTRITLLDRSPFPTPSGASIDTSRIIRADYSDPAYARLAAAAQTIWRQQGADELGGQGRYTESGLLLVADKGTQGEEYVRKSYENVKELLGEDAVVECKSREEISALVGGGGGTGDWGYLNTKSGWADAEAAMRWYRKQLELLKRVTFLTAEVQSLLYADSRVLGVNLADGKTLTADLTILATGAWTGSLLNLQGHLTATAQVLTYLPLAPTEQALYGRMPTLLNMSTGMFIIPPSHNLLKVARHGYGYSNPVTSPSFPSNSQSPSTSTTSLPAPPPPHLPHHPSPPEGLSACRAALTSFLPALASRPFTSSRLCWYTDTPTGDFLIAHHPQHAGLFLATGGSGHGYKFLPVIGEKIVDAVEGRLEGGLRERWAWREGKGEVWTEDGSRGGRRGMVLEEEMGKGMGSKL